MKIFLAITKTIFKRSIYYRLGYMLSIVIYPIYLLLWIAVYSGLFHFTGSSTLAGYDLARLIWYQAGCLFIGTIIYNETDWTIAHKIISGDLVQDLLKPVSIFKYEIGTALGMRLMAFCVEIVPSAFILPCLYFPSFMTIGALLRFIPLAVGAFLINFHLSFLVGLLSFAMKSTNSIRPIRSIIFITLGGGYIPLDFFPPFVTAVNAWLPFQYVVYFPVRVLINMPGTQTALEYVRILGLQALWILILFVLCRILWRGAYKKFCAVG